jgi:hypothetical protein
MKHGIALIALLAAGIATSFAIAAPPPGKGPNKSTSTSTSPGKSGDHKNAAKCRPLNLKGTVDGGTISLKVTKAAGPKGKDLIGTTAQLSLKGNVSVQAWSCSTEGSATSQLMLRQLHTAGKPQPAATTTP